MILFTAKVVEKRTIGLIMIHISVAAFIFILLSMLVPSLQSLASFFFTALIIIIIIAATLFKGDLSSYKMANELLVFPGELHICHIIFPFNEIDRLKFCFDSFHLTTTDTHHFGGINNKITFTYKKQAFAYQFFLASRQHFHQFIGMLEQLYRHQVPFEEANSHGKTFMMKNVNESEYNFMKQKYQRF